MPVRSYYFRIIIRFLPLQGADFKLSRLSCRHIYPCNGRTGPGKVSLEPHEYKEDFDMSQAKIGHSKLSLEQIDRREANLICAGHFLAILAIFGWPKSMENKTFFPSQLFFSILLNMEMKLEKRNEVQIIFSIFLWRLKIVNNLQEC